MYIYAINCAIHPITILSYIAVTFQLQKFIDTLATINIFYPELIHETKSESNR